MSNQAYDEMYGLRPADASADESGKASMLDQMRDRLASLSDEARSIRSQVPREFEPDVERIQQQMQRLGERLSDLSRGALVPYNATRVYERRIKTVRYVTEDDARVGRAQPNEVIALGGPGASKSNPSRTGAYRPGEQDQDPNPWDEAAANALVELYESGEALRREPVAAMGSRPGAAMMASRAVQRPSGVGSVPVSMTGRTVQPGCAMEQGLLDQRFADIAARIEQSLAQIRPEAALASLGHRFDQLEAQLNAVLGQVATRADIDELRNAEVQIEEIASQLTQFRSQMARLDLIDAHLGTLTSQLSDERLTRLFNEGVHVNADVGRLDAIDAQLRMIAVQLSDERLSGLVSRSAARDVDYEDVANAAAARVAASLHDTQHQEERVREIGEVRGMLENLINERRHNDENNASMLETMQQAIIRVLDRIDALELAQQEAVPAPAAPAHVAPAHVAPVHVAPAPAAPASLAARTAAAIPSYDDLVPPTATVYAQMPAMEAEPSDFLPAEPDESARADMAAYHLDTAAEQAPPRIPVYTTASFDLDKAFSSARDTEAESFGEPQPETRPIEVLRHDFIADAHRAKLKAASKPDASIVGDIRAGELSVGAKEPPPKARRRSIFSFRSQRVAMSLLIVLAAVPAAIFFMPRTSPERLEAAPAAISLPASASSGSLAEPTDEAPVQPAEPHLAPPAPGVPSKQTRQDGLELQQQGTGPYQDANVAGAPMDTASLPDGITMQGVPTTGQQLAQQKEQAQMAYFSGQLGLAAAKATPAALMQEEVLRRNGAAPAEGEAGSGLPPATVGPFSLRLAAAQGDASAQFEVASRLAEGKGIDQDLQEAAQWYQRAAANGFPMAQFRLGTLYERGLGVKADPQRAKVWYERAAAQGNVKAMHNLAVLTASRAPEPDYKRAAQWFALASEYGLSDSQFNLAVLYENGLGVAKDLNEAYKWMSLAAKSGDKDATARRDALKTKLDAGTVAAVEAQAAAFRAKPITGMANDARLAGQAWRGADRQG